MWSLKAWGQGSGAPAYRQVVQRPAGQSVREGLEPGIADRVVAQAEKDQLVQRPAPNCGGKSGDPRVANLVRVEHKHLHIAHQTERLSQERTPAKSQGMGTRQ